jgi:diguanylate cyclase (GGDEF)-like protein/PAS domain S-box-containing protein
MRSRVAIVAAMTVTVVLGATALSALSIQNSYASGVATETSKLSATAQVIAQLLHQEMIGAEEVEQATCEQPAFIHAVGSGSPQGSNLSEVQSVLAEVQALRPEYQFASLATTQGFIIANAPPNPALIGENFSFRDWYQGILKTGSTFVSTGYVSAVTGAPLVVAIATPIRAPAADGSTAPGAGPLVAILFIGYKIGSLQTLADQLASLQQIQVQVTDQDGVILTRTGGISGHLTPAPVTADLKAALGGRSATATSSGAIQVSVPVEGIGWTVSTTALLSGTLAVSSRNTTIVIALGLLLVLSLAGGAMVLTTRRLEHANVAHAAQSAELRTVLEALTEAIQVFDANGEMVTRNDAAARVYELTSEERSTAAITPKWDVVGEDGAPMSIEDGPLAKSRRTGKASQSVIVGLRRRFDGRVKWQSISTVPILGPGGRIMGYVSCAGDITERVETTRSLRVLTRAAQQLSSSLIVDQVIDAITQAASELTASPGESPRRTVLLMIDGSTMTSTGQSDPASASPRSHDAIPVTEHPYVERVIATGLPVVASFHHDEFGPHVASMLKKAGITNGALVPMLSEDRVFAIIAVTGTKHLHVSQLQVEHLKTLATIGALAFANASAHSRAEALARTDPLTGIGNRRMLADRLGQLGRQRFAIIAIDVDGLKVVNDTHGHDAGDALLSGVATAMNKELRPPDVLVRTGGDEFVALLIDCDAEGAVQCTLRLQRAVRQVAFSWGAASVSIGSAAGGPGASSIDVATRADQSLYIAKQSAYAERAAAAAALTT